MKNLPKILKTIFLIIFILQMLSIIFLLAIPNLTQAITFNPQVDIGGPSGDIKCDSIGKYIQAIYKYAIGIVGIVAAVVLMIGGVVWITAGGNQTRIGEAKAWIGASLTGLIIALTSYMILYTVNPALVQFQPICPMKSGITMNCCSEKKGLFGGFVKTVNNKQKYSCEPNTQKEKDDYGTIWEIINNQACERSGNTYSAVVKGCCQITYAPNIKVYKCVQVTETQCNSYKGAGFKSTEYCNNSGLCTSSN